MPTTPRLTITCLEGPVPCPECEGEGQLEGVRWDDSDGLVPCPECAGSGEIEPPCLSCGDVDDAPTHYAVDWDDYATHYTCRQHLWRALPEEVAQWLGIDRETEAADDARDAARFARIDAMIAAARGAA